MLYAIARSIFEDPNIHRLYLLCICLLVFSNTVKAYEPRKGHLTLTELAVEGYNLCFATQRIDDKAQARLVQGNIAMDVGVGELDKKDLTKPNVLPLFHVINRTINWHFYNPNKVDNTRQKNVEMSFKRLWQRAKDGLDNASAVQDLWLFAGALLHFTQDASVPAHVVPIYHGPSQALKWLGDFSSLTQYMQTADRVEGFWLAQAVKDPIDGIPVDKKRTIETLKATLAKHCNTINAEANSSSLEQIRDQLAHDTLSSLTTNIPDCKHLTWSRFYDTPIHGDLPSQQYFMAYTTHNGFPAFGEQGQLVDDKGNLACTMEDNDARYQDFIFARHWAALKTDITLLRRIYLSFFKKTAS